MHYQRLALVTSVFPAHNTFSLNPSSVCGLSNVSGKKNRQSVLSSCDGTTAESRHLESTDSVMALRSTIFTVNTEFYSFVLGGWCFFGPVGLLFESERGVSLRSRPGWRSCYISHKCISPLSLLECSFIRIWKPYFSHIASLFSDSRCFSYLLSVSHKSLICLVVCQPPLPIS